MAGSPVIHGQSRAIGMLSSALRSARVHHAWIFSGPRGVGKFTVAQQFARVLLDPAAARDADLAAPIHAPGSRVQQLIDAGTHPDLHIIRKELALYSDIKKLRDRKLLRIPLDLMRERLLGGKTADDRVHDAPAYRTAAMNHGKVFIVDEAELLDDVSQNAMLKTLEEPPPDTTFVLVTSQPERMLVTIRSRCQHVRFHPLDAASMARAMRDAAAGPEHSRDALEWSIAFAEGSPGLARIALAYGFFRWQEAVAPMLDALDREEYPPALGSTLGELVEEFAQAWVKAHGATHTSKDAANKDGARYVLTLLGAHVRKGLAAAAREGEARRENAQRMVNAAHRLRQAEHSLDANVNVKLVMEELVSSWASGLPAAV